MTEYFWATSVPKGVTLITYPTFADLATSQKSFQEFDSIMLGKIFYFSGCQEQVGLEWALVFGKSLWKEKKDLLDDEVEEEEEKEGR